MRLLKGLSFAATMSVLEFQVTISLHECDGVTCSIIIQFFETITHRAMSTCYVTVHVVSRIYVHDIIGMALPLYTAAKQGANYWCHESLE